MLSKNNQLFPCNKLFGQCVAPSSKFQLTDGIISGYIQMYVGHAQREQSH